MDLMTRLPNPNNELECKEHVRQYIVKSGELMPEGKPDFQSIPHYPSIKQLSQKDHKGAKIVRAMITTIVTYFCNSLNLKWHMNDLQILDAACMLLDECDNYRIEDYIMMFSLAKRGKLIKIYDRMDIELICKIREAYELLRQEEGEKASQKIEEELQQKRHSENQKSVEKDYSADLVTALKHIEDLKTKSAKEREEKWDAFKNNKKKSIEKMVRQYENLNLNGEHAKQILADIKKAAGIE